MNILHGQRALVISPAGAVYDRDCVKWYPQSQEEIETKYFNTGDMIVYDSTLKIFNLDEVQGMNIISPSSFELEEYKKYDFIFVRASNFIHNNMEWHRAVEIIEQTNLPVYAIGVGGQATSREKYKLTGKNLRFWQAVSERSTVIGVRGTYTAEILYANGIKNVEICGCPSIFRSKNRNLQIIKPSKISDVAFSIRREVDAEYTTNVRDYIVQQRDMLIMADNTYNLAVTIHGEPEEKAYYFKREDLIEKAKKEFFASRWWTQENCIQMENIYRKKLFFFLKVKDYDEFIMKQDMALGYRVHGVLPALANGIPAVILKYDSRSAELADTHAIPSIDIDEAKLMSPTEILDRASFDEFNKTYATKYDKMKFVLDQNGISHRL